MEVMTEVNLGKPRERAAAAVIPTMPVLSEYLDFRKFLADYYDYRRELSRRDLRPYTYAVFSAAANIKSPNYLRMIIEGQRNLSSDMTAKFAKAMGFQKQQAEEFDMLVRFGQASDQAERNLFLKELNEYRVNSKLRSGEIDQKAFDKVPNWVAWVLYSMLDQDGVKFEVSKLRPLLREKASESEIKAALESLVMAGQVRRDENGELRKSRSLTDGAEDIPVALVRKLQAELMYLGLESLFRDSPTEREFGTATLAMTKEEFEELRFKLRQLRKATQKDNSVKREMVKGERVYQLNLQLFPVTDRAKI